ncbi:MAG: hypothetical protein JNN08_00415, partial [Bryobacterales bacterium]|nr:hypothetical protein [Bryobacterales bacterium]
GDLYALVVSKLQGQDSKRCLTSAAFYRIRRGLVDALQFDRRQIRPSTRLETILPLNGRRDSWRRLQASTKLKLPALRPTARLQAVFLSLGIVMTVAPGIYARIAPAWFLLLLLLGLIVGGLLIRLFPSLATEFPLQNPSVGYLSREVLAMNHAQLSAELGSWNKQEVWQSLCRLIAARTSLDPAQVKPESQISGDLGID